MSNVPVGYKQTDVGVIPEDWEVKQVKDFAAVKGGKRLPAGKSLVNTITPHPYIRVTDMTQGGINFDEIKYVPDDVFPAIKNYRISVQDIFISVAGTLGIVGKIPLKLDGANLTENANKITNIECDRDFLLFNLISERIQSIIESAKTVGAQPKLALGRIERFLIAMPPTLTEQTAIATALSDVDALLNQLDKLIAKKRDIKQATMQQLLTGKKRLAGFSGEWEVKKLGDVADITMGQSPNSNSYNNKGIGLPLIQGNADIKHRKTIRRIYTTDIIKKAKSGSIIMSVRAPVGEIAYSVFDICLGRGVCAISSKSNNIFLLNLLIFLEKKWGNLSKGSTFDSVNSDDIKKFEVTMPLCIIEQTAIATLLTDMDNEISQLQQRRHKTHALKQGMMQQLLTGKIRLVEQ